MQIMLQVLWFRLSMNYHIQAQVVLADSSLSTANKGLPRAEKRQVFFVAQHPRRMYPERQRRVARSKVLYAQQDLRSLYDIRITSGTLVMLQVQVCRINSQCYRPETCIRKYNIVDKGSSKRGQQA